MSPTDEDALPDLVYLPCKEHVAEVADARPLLHRLPDGELLLPAYSTADRLYAAWGDGHPWLALPSAGLEALHDSQHFDVVALDLPPAEEADDAR
ncbi:SAV_915 family protein [Fodinicola acaciae]|uniref:SAV_915 family protein n=1 Tax=Fodinicola acaciae TaxID=2681555 RepID=UPI0013D7C392|nr:SAV_915 family protein [Fodinicola acaciae]